MVKDVVRDILFLSIPSKTATLDDLKVVNDLLDTLSANGDRCVGMAANMIGVSKRIIVFADGGKYSFMLNPEIIKCSESFESEEGCLSLDGTRKTRRYKSIKVKYQNEKLEPRIKSYVGFTAQIIQHEIDHCNGKII